MFTAAAIQLTSTSNQEKSILSATGLIERAASNGADLITTPEATNYLGPHSEKVAMAETIDGPTVGYFSGLANKHNIHLLLGSFNEASDDPTRCYNTSVLFGPDGDILTTYRKIHLFDVHTAEVDFQESKTTRAGSEPVVVDTALGPIGLSICYDLRFPHLYAKLASMGAKIILIPSAFTLTTGKDHWHPLLRARAIETQSFIIAPGQWGHHDDGGLRNSYGHSMIVDPWGQILAMAPDGTGIATAEIDLDRVDKIRATMPLCDHRINLS